jgi:hypothetical protein
MGGSNIKGAFLEFCIYQAGKYIRLTGQASGCGSLFPIIWYILHCSFHLHCSIVYTLYWFEWLFGLKPRASRISSLDNYPLQEKRLGVSSAICEMLFKYLFALVIQLCWVPLGFAQQDATIVCLPPQRTTYRRTDDI